MASVERRGMEVSPLDVGGRPTPCVGSFTIDKDRDLDLTPPPEEHSHGAHSATGHKWLDTTLGLSALAISLFSAVMTLQHGRAMEKMVDQNARMVEASTWPYVTVADSNGDGEGHRLYKVMVLNNGVGPARVGALELFYRGRPVADAFDLATRVSTHAGVAGRPAIVSSGIGGVIPARQSVDIFTVKAPISSDALIDAFNRSRADIVVRVCYCSIFEDCWRTSSAMTAPRRVSSCDPAPKAA